MGVRIGPVGEGEELSIATLLPLQVQCSGQSLLLSVKSMTTGAAEICALTVTAHFTSVCVCVCLHVVLP